MKINLDSLRTGIEGIRGRRERLGIEIDGRTVRIVKLVRGHDEGYALRSFSSLKLDLMHSSEVERQRFKQVIREIGGGLLRCAVNAEHPSLRIRRMVFAKMPERDILEAIRWNFRDHIEGPIEKYVVGFTTLSEPVEEGRVALIAYGLASEAIEEYGKVIKSVGLKTNSLEPSASSLLASFNANGMLADGKYHACVAFGDSITLFSVMKDVSLLFCRPLPGISNDALARLIMRNLNLDAERANLALAAWIEGKPAPQGIDEVLLRRIDTTVGHFYSQYVIEMQRSIDAFCIMYGVDRIDTIHVCGQGAFYPGIVEHMNKTLGIDTIVYNPFQKLMERERQTQDVLRVAPLYAIAVGLAIP